MRLPESRVRTIQPRRTLSLMNVWVSASRSMRSRKGRAGTPDTDTDHCAHAHDLPRCTLYISHRSTGGVRTRSQRFHGVVTRCSECITHSGEYGVPGAQRKHGAYLRTLPSS